MNISSTQTGTSYITWAAMLWIMQLPYEIIAEILRNFGQLQFLLPALLALRHFYTSFKECHGIEVSILRHQVTPALLPYAEDGTDRGPYESWRNIHADLTSETALMNHDDKWLHERAYVLWDRDRVQKQFNGGFGEDPGFREPFSEREHNDMLKSFDGR